MQRGEAETVRSLCQNPGKLMAAWFRVVGIGEGAGFGTYFEGKTDRVC